MKTITLILAATAASTASLSVTACGRADGAQDDLKWAFEADALTEEELALAQKCGRPELTPKQTLNVRYQSIDGVDPNLQSLDIYMPKVINPCLGVPVVVFVHGGGWRKGDKSQVKHKPAYFNGLGYAFVSVNYRLSPQNNNLSPDRIMFPVHPTDVGSAMAWVHKNIRSYGGNPEKIALLGHSAGGHLAALVGTDQSYIKKADDTWNAQHLRCVGSYDSEGYDIPRLMKDPDRAQEALYRNAFGSDPAIWTAASPINFVQKQGPDFQLVRRGDSERHAQVDAFKAALEKNLNRVDVINGQGLSHKDVNVLIGDPSDRRMTPAVTTFMKKNCFPR